MVENADQMRNSKLLTSVFLIRVRRRCLQSLNRRKQKLSSAAGVGDHFHRRNAGVGRKIAVAVRLLNAGDGTKLDASASGKNIAVKV